ncbi:MAG: LarC family nickel insertion protein [Pseudomonadales bacterium]|nr:LarC family nickel insertion protein [Pseudomonadales bacterium]
MSLHIHLDTVGGISGDMFVAALLDCWPEFAEHLEEQIAKAGFADLVKLDVSAKNDGVLQGTGFQVTDLNSSHPHHLLRHLGAPPAHDHRHYREIRAVLEASELAPDVKAHALGIFHCLAEAEARVHGKEIAAVAFHEVGAWDSIADIIAAAWLIAASGASSWSVSSLPLGRGLVKTAHGMLPLPAPAVALLLEGFRFHDDGLEGERITPTGAAILRYLEVSQQARPGIALRLQKSGLGFGSRHFPGLSNVLRILVFAADEVEKPWQEDQVLKLSFEIDDQSQEDLALGLDRIRNIEGVLDINQQAVTGKKQRAALSIQVLAEPGSADKVLAACFNETTTLGIRQQTLRRAILPRCSRTVELDERRYQAKVVRRPDGHFSAKAELSDLLHTKLNHGEREQLRQRIEAGALAAGPPGKGDDE